MPCRTPEEQREYQRLWVAARRTSFFKDKRCIDCGSYEQLELDHRDPAEKISHAVWSWSQIRRDEEIAKCDVRCHDCHVARHAQERSSHGIGGYKRGCRCQVCRAAKAINNANYRAGLKDAERRSRDLHPGTRLCRPLPSYSATAPEPPDDTQREAA